MQENVTFRTSETKHLKWEVVGQSHSVAPDPHSVIRRVRASAPNKRTTGISLLITTNTVSIRPKMQFLLHTRGLAGCISNCSLGKAHWLPNTTRSPEKAFDHPHSLPWTPPRLSGPAGCCYLAVWLEFEGHLCKPPCSKKNSIVQRKSPAWKSWEGTLNYCI